MIELLDPLINSDYFVLWMFPAILLCLFAGFHVAFSLMGVALLFGYFGFGDTVGPMLTGRVWDITNNYVLAAIPLFVFMGAMLSASGIAHRLFETMVLWTGRLRGGLAVGTVLMCTVFAAATGVIGASEVVIGLLAIPPMLQHRYNKSMICGTICAGGALGAIIPPAVVIIVYGPTAGVSVGRILVAAIFPGLLLAGLYILYILVRCYLRPEDGPGLPPEECSVPLPAKLKATFVGLMPPILLIFSVMGTILLGLAAPTEAAALGAFGSLLLCLFYKKLNWENFKSACLETLRISSMIMLVLTGGTMYTGVFLGMGGADTVEMLLNELHFSPYVLLFLFMFITFLLGFVLDNLSVILISVPVFSPLIARMGFDPVWFAVLFLVALQTSYLTPPMSPSIFYLKGIAPKEIHINDMFRGVVPFVGLQLLAIIILFLFPQISLWLPEVMIGFN